jgi:protein TonB
MPFEAYLAQGKSKPRKARWLTGTLSISIHGGLVIAALVYSFWHVDELSPPTVTVTFLTAAPPPPPPPPPKKKSAATKPKVTHELVQPTKTQLVQPKEKEEPKEEESKDDGVEGGVAGGVAGGTAGAIPVAAAKVESNEPRRISPAIGSQQLLTDPSKDPQYRVKIPEQLNRPGVKMFALINVCVSKEGNVTGVKFVKSMDPSVDPLLKQMVMSWRYKPLTVDDHPVPFCYNLRYDHQVR